MRVAQRRGQEVGGASGRGSDSDLAVPVTITIWTSRNTQAPARAQYSQPVWKLSRCGTGITKVVTQRKERISNFHIQNPLCIEARTPLLLPTPGQKIIINYIIFIILHIIPIFSTANPMKNTEIPNETW